MVDREKKAQEFRTEKKTSLSYNLFNSDNSQSWFLETTKTAEPIHSAATVQQTPIKTTLSDWNTITYTPMKSTANTTVTDTNTNKRQDTFNNLPLLAKSVTPDLFNPSSNINIVWSEVYNFFKNVQQDEDEVSNLFRQTISNISNQLIDKYTSKPLVWSMVTWVANRGLSQTKWLVNISRSANLMPNIQKKIVEKEFGEWVDYKKIWSEAIDYVTSGIEWLETDLFSTEFWKPTKESIEKWTIQSLKEWDIEWYVRNVWYQFWEFLPELVIWLLWWVFWLWVEWAAWWEILKKEALKNMFKITPWKAELMLSIFPSMMQEAYDYADVEMPNMSDEGKTVYSVIVWWLNSYWEVSLDLEALWWIFKWAKSWATLTTALLSKINKPLLRHIAWMWIADFWEWLEEVMQQLTEETWATIATWENKFSSLSNYIKTFIETELVAFPLTAGSSIVETRRLGKELEKTKEQTKFLYDLAENENVDEKTFRELWSKMWKTEEELNKILDDTQTWRDYWDIFEEEEDIEQPVSEEVKQEQQVEKEKQSALKEFNQTIRDINEQRQTTAIEDMTEEMRTQQANDITNAVLDYDNRVWSIQESTKAEVSSADTTLTGRYKPAFVNWKYTIPRWYKPLISSETDKISPELTKEETEKALIKWSEAIEANQKLIDWYRILYNYFSTLPEWEITQDEIDYIDNLPIEKWYVYRYIKAWWHDIEDILDMIAINTESAQWIMDATTKMLTKNAKRYWFLNYMESLDTYSVDFSNFVLKYKSKKKLKVWEIKAAIEKMAKVTWLDLVKIFEWCQIVIIDNWETWWNKKYFRTYWDMSLYIDWSWTPIIPVNINMARSEWLFSPEMTLVHELAHSVDAILCYKKWLTNHWEPHVWKIWIKFWWLLNESEFQSDREWLLKNMEMKWMSKRDVDYYSRPKEMLARTIQQYVYWWTPYYENWNVAVWFYKDNEKIKEIAERIIPYINEEWWVDSKVVVDEAYNQKINELVNSFDNLNVLDFLEAIKTVWDKLKELNQKLINSKDEKEKNNIQIQIDDNQTQLDLLSLEWIDYATLVLEHNVAGELLDLDTKLSAENVKLEWQKNQIENNINLHLLDTKNIDESLLSNKQREENKKKKKREKRETRKELWKSIDDFIKPLLSRLENISPRLAWSLVNMEAQYMQKVAWYNLDVYPFADQFKKLSDKDKRRLRKELFNYGMTETPIEEQRKALIKMCNEMKINISPVLEVIDKITTDFKNAWLKITENELYYPRYVTNYEWLIDYVTEKLKKGEWDEEYKLAMKNTLEKVKDVVRDDTLTPERKQLKIRDLLSDLQEKRKVSLSASPQKERTISNTEDWWDEILVFYADPVESIAHFITSMQDRIERSKFFGKWISTEAMGKISEKITSMWFDASEEVLNVIRDYVSWGWKWRIKKTLVNDFWMSKDDVDELLDLVDEIYTEDTDVSVTNITEQMVENWQLNKEDVALAEKLLKSYFWRRLTPEWIQNLKNSTYFLFLCNITNTLTQIWDFSFSLITNPRAALVALFKSILGKADIKTYEVWIENLFQDIAQDRQNIMSKTLTQTLKFSLFNLFDIKMKETLMWTVLTTMHNKANRKRAWRMLKTRLVEMYWEEMWNEIFDCYKSGKFRDDNWQLIAWVITDVMYNLWSAQPILKSSMPTEYNDSPKWRLFYSLRTYMIKAIDFFTQWTRRRYRAYRKDWSNVVVAWTKAWTWLLGSLLTYSVFDMLVQTLKDWWNSMLALALGKWDDDDNPLPRETTFIYIWQHEWFEKAYKQFFKDTLAAALNVSWYNESIKYAWQQLWFQWAASEFFTPPVLDFAWNCVMAADWAVNWILDEDKIGARYVQHPASMIMYMPFIGKQLYYSWWKKYAKEHKKMWWWTEQIQWTTSNKQTNKWEDKQTSQVSNKIEWKF